MSEFQKAAAALGQSENLSRQDVAVRLCERTADDLVILGDAIMAVTNHLELLSAARMSDFVQGSSVFLETTLIPLAEHLTFIRSFPDEWPHSN